MKPICTPQWQLNTNEIMNVTPPFYVLHSLGSSAWLPRCVDVIMCVCDSCQRAANAMQSLASPRKFKNGIAPSQARHVCLVCWLSRVC
jgi:hypothetical protein